MQSPFILVIFGATGDLAKNKLIPALFSLYKAGELPEEFFIIGFSRRDLSIGEFLSLFGEHASDNRWKAFTKHIFYQAGTFEDEKGYKELIAKLKILDGKLGACITRIFYLATPPANYETILDQLNKTKLSEGCGAADAEASVDKQGSGKWTRIAIEKPFGKDVETAKRLDLKLSEMFEERQIFRVDHYLGKETVQNLLVFRFANSIFDPVWNKEYIDHVQITWAETKGIDGRGKFFDGVGLLRDVGQNHLMQFVAAIVMEMPKSFEREDVRDARVKAIQAVRCLDPQEVPQQVVRGQYDGYKNEHDVSKDTQTETYIAAKFFVDTPRFLDVPFYLRAGKFLAENTATISIVFKQTCHLLFKEIGCPEEGNILTIRIQPNEGLYFKIIAKKPGAKLALKTAEMHFSYNEAFGTQGIDAYQKLLSDILAGDQMLFNRSDELVSSWQFITNILEGWEKYQPPVFVYQRGTMGPVASDDLMKKDGRKWI